MAEKKKKTTVFGSKKKAVKSAPKPAEKPDPKTVAVSAPRPKTKPGRPTLAEAKKIAKGATQRAKSARPGMVENQDPDLHYYYWDALELTEARQVKLRLMLEGRGFWKSDGDEYVQGVPHAEIWATYKEVQAQLEEESKRKHDEIKRRLLAGR
jgi:hypothetical protein